MNTKIQVWARDVPWPGSYAVEQDVNAVASQTDIRHAREITPESALAIASWWQSPGTVGSVLALFASGAEVDRDALLDDIHATRVTERNMSEFDTRALDCLSTFVINYGK